MMQRIRKAQEGFTLIELVVVVAILGILAVIVTPKVIGAIDNAKQNSDVSSAKQVQVAMDRMYAETGAYPTVTAFNCSNNVCVIDDVVATLASYVNLNKADFTTPAPTYVPSNGSYTLTLSFLNNKKTYTITPTTIQ